jgi:GTPase involved in cell partitioning and DNA repair
MNRPSYRIENTIDEFPEPTSVSHAENTDIEGRKPPYSYLEAKKYYEISAEQSDLITMVRPAIDKNNERKLSLEELLPRKEELYNNRMVLVEKKLEHTITKKEENQLTYIEWQLDRLEDAISGEESDKLDRMVEVHTALAETITRMVDDIKKAKPSAFKTRNKEWTVSKKKR